MNTTTLTISDDQQYQSVLSQLSSMRPVEAIQLAEEINDLNGFNFISEFTIAKWKREAAKIKKVQTEMQKGYMQLFSNYSLSSK